MKKFGLILVLLAGIMLAGCAGADLNTNNGLPYEDISPAALADMIAERRDSFVLVNTHIPFEGDIPDTDLSIPYNDIANQLDKLPQDKNAEIVLYCRSDNMSRTAAQTLAELGYTNLKNLDGGFIAWQAAGFPFETQP